MKKVYFVRHGQTDANLHELVPGKDTSLNEHGFSQALALAERTEGIDFDVLIASDLLRAQQTAEVIAKVKGADVEINPLFSETMESSSMEGRSEFDEEVTKYRNDRNENMTNPDWRHEDGETFPDAFKRITDAKLFLEKAPQDNILIVSHAFFTMLFSATILLDAQEPSIEWFKTARRFKLSNTGVTLFTYDEGKWQILMWNDHAHFAE